MASTKTKAPAKGKARTRRTRKKGGPDWKPKFLEALRETGLVKDACAAAAVGRSTVYEARQQDEDFALAWHDIEEETTERMEREAIRRAADGVERPVHYKGERVDSVTEYSDTLLIFMLKARRPEVYRETTRHEHTGPDGGPITFADLASAAID
jgi:hypothetical protein